MSEPTNSTGEDLPQREPRWEGVSERPPGGNGGGVEPTGDPGVDAAMARLAGIDPHLDPASQLPVLAEIHEALQQRLSSTEG